MRLQLTTSEEQRQVLKPEKVEIIIKMTRNSINKLSVSLVEQQASPPPILGSPAHFPQRTGGGGGRTVEAKWFETTPATVRKVLSLWLQGFFFFRTMPEEKITPGHLSVLQMKRPRWELCTVAQHGKSLGSATQNRNNLGAPPPPASSSLRSAAKLTCM